MNLTAGKFSQTKPLNLVSLSSALLSVFMCRGTRLTWELWALLIIPFTASPHCTVNTKHPPPPGGPPVWCHHKCVADSVQCSVWQIHQPRESFPSHLPPSLTARRASHSQTDFYFLSVVGNMKVTTSSSSSNSLKHFNDFRNRFFFISREVTNWNERITLASMLKL